MVEYQKVLEILELCADENKDYILHLVKRVVDQDSLQRKVVWNANLQQNGVRICLQLMPPA